MRSVGKNRMAFAFLIGAILGGLAGWWGGIIGRQEAAVLTERELPPFPPSVIVRSKSSVARQSTNIPAASVDQRVNVQPVETLDYLTLLNEAARISDDSTRRNRIGELLASWVAVNPEMAWRYARTQSPLSDREFAIESVLKPWAKKDATHVLGLAGELTAQYGRDRAWRWIVQATAETEPQATIHAIEQLPIGRLQAELFGETARFWSRKDPYSALAWANALPAGEGQGRAMESVFSGWSDVDVKSAAGEAAGLPIGPVKNAALRAVARRYAAADPYGAIWWMQSMAPGNEQKEVWQAMSRGGFADYFKNQSPAAGLGAATQLMNSLKDDEQKQFVAALVAGLVGRASPDQVRAWVVQLPEGSARNDAIKSLLSVWSDTNPADATAFALENLRGRERGEYLERIVGRWAYFDSTAVLEFARNLPDDAERQQMMRGVLGALSRVNPAQAAGLINELPVGKPRDDAAGQILQSWANVDPQAATAWLEQFPESDARTRGYYAVARSWGLNDYPAAATWIRSQPAGPDRDEAIRAFVQSVDGADIALANQWAAAIQDPQKRRQSSEQVFGRWLSEDSARASDWVQNGQMDSSLRAYLRSLRERWRQSQQSQ